IEPAADISFASTNHAGTAERGSRARGGATITLEVKNGRAKAENGTLVVCVAGMKFEKRIELRASATTEVAVDLPLSEFRLRWGAEPIYAAFIGEQRFAAGGEFIFYSRIIDAREKPVSFAVGDFSTFALDEQKQAQPACPVSRLDVQCTADDFTFDFDWTDATPVYAKPGFKNRFGQEIGTPLDLNSREGQPCDAVEFIIDLRPLHSIGRPTANIDANPDGVLRIGVYTEEADGKPVVKVQSLPELNAERLSISQAGGSRYVLTVKARAAGPCAGFTVRVTDNTEFKLASTPLLLLTGRVGTGQEQMSYIQLGDAAGVLYRIGY
ncbi:MAG TPA: hypothetical protein VM223_26235, partial [Planctomycetota bacterium]|nr:hypothetical protein [Planctomycetota bacterium]